MLSRLMAGLRAGWRRLWFAPCDPLPAAAFRLSLGTLLVFMYLALRPHWARYFGADGVLSLADPSLAQEPPDTWSAFEWLPLLPFGAFWLLGLTAAVGFTIGWRTRLCTAVLFVMEMSMIHRNRFAISGEDLVARAMLFFGLFAPLDRALSVDGWLRRKRGVASPPAAPSVWPVRLMQLQTALVYVISLPNKLADDSAWAKGQAIYLTMASNTWSRTPWPWLFYGHLGTLMTYFTMAVEGTFPLLVWFPATRLYAVAALASLHLGIAIMLKNVTFFSLSMVCCCWLFVPPSSLRRGWAWAADQVRRWSHG